MKYIPCTIEEEKAMLKYIGIKNFNELLNVIPKNLRFKDFYETFYKSLPIVDSEKAMKFID